MIQQNAITENRPY